MARACTTIMSMYFYSILHYVYAPPVVVVVGVVGVVVIVGVALVVVVVYVVVVVVVTPVIRVVGVARSKSLWVRHLRQLLLTLKQASQASKSN